MMQAIGALTGAGAAAGTAGAASQTTPQPRLVRAAHEFEAQMMKELMKPLQESSSLDGSDDDADSGSSGALGEFASEALGRALSEGGGFGIANRIVHQLSAGNHAGNQNGTAAVIKDVHMNTVMKAAQ